jgi:demethoxyubiquinone hydroxylase (CLK1/Coq7/Cat5 family)
MDTDDKISPVEMARLGIIDSLSGLVGKKITPMLVTTVEEVVLSHVREYNLESALVKPELEKFLENLRRRVRP